MIGAAVGGGFTDTKELRVIKYKEAMKTKEKPEWDAAVMEEHRRFVNHDVFEVAKLSEVSTGEKMLTTTWAMKKSNRTYRARMNMRGYEQDDGGHCDSASTSSPVTNYVSNRVLLVLMIMVENNTYIVDVQGTFLHGEFDNGKVLY